MDKIQSRMLVGVIFLTLGLGLSVFYTDSNEENMNIALNATNAYDAARQISANNQMEIIINMISMFCIGIGGVLTVVSFFQLKKNKKTTE